MKDGLEDNCAASLPDPNRARRFALITATILLVYVLAGGHIKGEIKTPLIDLISFNRPEVLLFFLGLTSVYATARYWYYAIKLPFTRTKWRHHLRTAESILVYIKTKQDYLKTIEGASNDEYLKVHSFLIHRSPAELDPIELIVGGGQRSSPSDQIPWDLLRALVARQFASYFPGLTWEDITIEKNPSQAATVWASVDKPKLSTRLRTLAEDLDLYLPVYLNVIALVLFIVSSI